MKRLVSETFGQEMTEELRGRGYPVLMDIFDLQADFMGCYAWDGKSVIEFGAFDGRHSEVALRLGAESATVIEGRVENLMNARPLQPEKVRFYVEDIRRLHVDHEAADVGLIFGVLYHLDNPVKFLREALRLCRESVFIWTHVASVNDMECEGYQGQAFTDAGNTDNSALEPLTAFWFEGVELDRCLADLGFVTTKLVRMPTPVTPGRPAVCLRAERVR